MAEIRQVFKVNHSRETVWRKFKDLPSVVGCIPGASLAEAPVDNVARGQIAVKLGPVKANFGGEATVEYDEANHTGTITGVGIDKSHSSRAKGKVTYVVSEAGADTSEVTVVVDYTLSGSLAQFARGGIVEAVADQICQDFVANLEAELLAANAPAPVPAAVAGEDEAADASPAEAAPVEQPAARPAAPQRELNVFLLLWTIIKRKIRRLFGGG
ncbi:SRPBCC family protein [Pseudochelatococcus sp. B33]